ncbi:flavoprotein [Streptomyces sp. NPDC002870]|uniref:flavoprotein n=1 Tax=Streptomyces sp. NPDC002870 TaxID=3364666 RepID=UPI00368F5DDE
MSSIQGKVLGVVGSSAGGVEELRTALVIPALERGWTVAVTLTPTAGEWLRTSGEAARIEELTGLPVRAEPRLPGDSRPHPPVDCYVVAPASANTVAKLALGISDNQALTQVNEAIGTLDLPVVVWPRVNAAHARHPAWEGHIKALRDAGVRLVYGSEVWPLAEPRAGMPGRQYPWDAALSEAEQAIS